MGGLLRNEHAEDCRVGECSVIPIVTESGFVPSPCKAKLIEEALSAVRQGATKRAAGLSIYDRYYRTNFNNDDPKSREDRLRDIAKIIRSRL